MENFIFCAELRLKMNICVLEQSILFSKDLLFLYYIKVIEFWLFGQKLIFSYISFFYFALDMSLISWCIIYDTQFIFFPKIKKATFINQFRLKTKLYSRFLVKTKKCGNGLKYLARIKFWKKGKLKLGKI